ncbi:MAG: peptide ABC transporter substrate-binding protein [Chloroflexota bacterium]|nr:peptide ABC transporter substrate-binding protein [Chloroflexota bacterium]
MKLRRQPTLVVTVGIVLLQVLGIMGTSIAAAQDSTPLASPGASPVAGSTVQLAEIPVAPGSEQPDADPNATLTLNLGSEITTGDPQVLAFLNEIEIASKVFAPLLALNEENLPAAHAAESMAISADGTTYTFTLRSGMTYSDGVPVTAANYAYAIKRGCSPEVAGDYSNILFAIVGCEEWRGADPAAAETAQLEEAVDEAIRALDDRTLQIQLKFAAGYFPYVMATWITYPSRQDLVEQGGPDWWMDPTLYVGNGPFKVVSWTRDQEWRFERNDSYFKGAPGIETLVYREVDSPETELLAYQQGEFDLIGPSSTLFPQIQADPTLSQQLQRQVGANTYYMAFNNAAEPFNNLQVRQAFAAALNREQYINQILNGVGRPATTFLYPGIPGYQEETQQTYDPERAKQLLAEAGYPNGEGFPTLQLRYASDSAAAQQIATYWAQNLLQVLNVTIEPTPIDVAELQRLRTERDPSLIIYLGNWFEDYPHPQNWLSLVFGPGSTRSPLGWDNAEFNELVTQADQLPIEEAIPLYQQADALLAEQAPVAFYLHGENLALVSPALQGYVTYPTSVVDTVYQMEKIYKTAS